MTLTLRIENFDQLSDGGPTHFAVNQRGFEIGRAQHLDWTLPDPDRFISGHHCEVRYENGAYVMYDVSRNGTMYNGSEARMKSPQILANGDQLQIGHYIISVSIEAPVFVENDADIPDPVQAGGGGGNDSIWDVGGPVPEPVDRREFLRDRNRGTPAPDFGQERIDMPVYQPPAAPEPAPAPAYAAPAGGGSPFADEPVAAPAPPPPPPPQPAPAPPAAPPQQAAYPQPQAPAPQAPPPAPPAMPEDDASIPPRARPIPGGGESFGRSQPMAAPAHAPQPAPMPAPGSAPVARPPQPEPAPAPPPPPAQPQPQATPAAESGGMDAMLLLTAMAEAAGVSRETFTSRPPMEMAQEIGRVLRCSTEELTGLLKARAAAKKMAKSADRTMISASDNNAMKFVPSSAEAMEVMFAQNRPGYLGAFESFQSSFEDLKRHEVATYSAMQKALGQLLDGLSPEAIESRVKSGGIAGKKSKAWELFVERWHENTEPHENGMLDVFLDHFADAYDEASRKK